MRISFETLELFSLILIFISVPTVLAATGGNETLEITTTGGNETLEITTTGGNETLEITTTGGNETVETTYPTLLSLQVVNGSSPGNIKVNPELTYGSGSKLSVSSVKIYVDGNFTTEVSSNQWSSDILVGLGNHTIKASVPEITDPSNSLVKYQSSSDTVINYAGITEETFPIEYIIIVIIATIVVISAAILHLKKSRKQKISKQAVSRPKFCRKCGSKLLEKDKFCGKCGKSLLVKQ